MSDRETFGQMLARLRKRAGLSQNQLALRSSVNPAHVHRMESGAGKPSRTVLRMLAAVMGASDAETDRLLYAAGLAPERDWQALAEDAIARLEGIRGHTDGWSPPVAPTPVLPFVRRSVG
jgi:transcriptional regulator with XRE-family HTH domain